MKRLVVLLCYLAFARGTFLLPLLLYSLMNPRTPLTNPKPEPLRYDFVKVHDHFDHHADDHGHAHGDRHGVPGTHNDHHDRHHYRVVKLEPPKIKVVPGLVKISDPVVKVKVKVTKDNDYDDHTDKYDY